MAGQPDLTGWLVFDVTDLKLDDNTVHEGDSFDITVDFTGTGGIWTLLEQLSITATTKFYAEGMGIGAGEYDLGSKDTPLVPNTGSYSETLTVDTSAATTALAEGVYRIQCLVQVLNSGIMGYYGEDLLLSVYD